MRGPELIPRLLAAGAALAISAQPGTGQATPSVELPKPTGPYSVGTTTVRLVDEARTDPLADAPEKRQVTVHAWYPAATAASGHRAPYLREGVEEARTFATLLRQPETALDYLGDTLTHSILDAAPHPGDRLPVLVFSHGYTGIGSSHTALLEDLASHGYGVLSIVHPYEVVAATLGDGRVITMLDAGKQMRKSVRGVLEEWAKEGDTMAAVTRAKDEAEATELMRGYLKTLPATTAVVARWVEDSLLAVNRLPALADGPAARLATRLDLERIGAFGHSMGGVVSAELCAADRRCRAALNLDGIPQYGSLIDRTSGKPFLMVYSSREGRLGASDVIYRRATRPYWRVDVAETLHLDFSDMVLWGGPLAARPMFGKLPAARAVALTRQIVREYFDQELRGRGSPLLSGSTAVEGVRVHPPGGP